MSHFQLYQEDPRPVSTVKPERDLLSAVLARAFLDLVSSDAEERRSALAWINDKEDNKAFSFVWVMRHLDLAETIERVRKMCQEEFQQTAEHYAQELTAQRRNWRTRVFKFS